MCLSFMHVDFATISKLMYRKITTTSDIFRSSLPEVLLVKGVLKI